MQKPAQQPWIVLGKIFCQALQQVIYLPFVLADWIFAGNRTTNFTLASLVIGRNKVDKGGLFQPTHPKTEL